MISVQSISPASGREVCAKSAQALSKGDIPDTIRLPACCIILKSHSLPFRSRQPPEIPPFGIPGGFVLRHSLQQASLFAVCARAAMHRTENNGTSFINVHIIATCVFVKYIAFFGKIWYALIGGSIHCHPINITGDTAMLRYSAPQSDSLRTRFRCGFRLWRGQLKIICVSA